MITFGAPSAGPMYGDNTGMGLSTDEAIPAHVVITIPTSANGARASRLRLPAHTTDADADTSAMRASGNDQHEPDHGAATTSSAPGTCCPSSLATTDRLAPTTSSSCSNRHLCAPNGATTGNWYGVPSAGFLQLERLVHVDELRHRAASVFPMNSIESRRGPHRQSLVRPSTLALARRPA